MIVANDGLSIYAVDFQHYSDGLSVTCV